MKNFSDMLQEISPLPIVPIDSGALQTENITTKSVMEISGIMSVLLADEITTWYTAWMGYQNCKGTAQHAVSLILEEIAEEELQHAQELIEWTSANNIPIETNLTNLINTSNLILSPSFLAMTTREVVEIIIKAERTAIKSYKEAKVLVESQFPDLAYRFMEISLDEERHLNDVLDLASEIGLPNEVESGTSLTGVEFKGFSKKNEKIKPISKIIDSFNIIFDILKKTNVEENNFMRMFDEYRKIKYSDFLTYFNKGEDELLNSYQSFCEGMEQEWQDFEENNFETPTAIRNNKSLQNNIKDIQNLTANYVSDNVISKSFSKMLEQLNI